MLALFETHAGGDNASRICQNLGFEHAFRVDAVGQSGGIWLLWRSCVGTVNIIESSDQFVHARVVKEGENLHIIAVYAAPTVSRRSGLWEKLKEVLQGVTDPVIIGGDFNSIVRLDERTGGNGRLSLDSIAFGEWINETLLIDMGFTGNKFTWRRGRSMNHYVAKRLDRIFCCAQARLQWQEASVKHLPFMASDHAPLYMQLCPQAKGNPRRRPFRFEAAWLKHSGFKELLANSWNGELTTPDALKGLQVTLQKWNSEIFGDIQKRKDKLSLDIKVVQDQLDLHQTNILIQKEEELLKELYVVLEQEEILWFQKSREKWVALGDRNTKFFHMSTVIRRSKNRIDTLRNDEGRWISDPCELEASAIEFYKRLYSLEDVEQVVQSLPLPGFVKLSQAELTELEKPFTS